MHCTTRSIELLHGMTFDAKHRNMGRREDSHFHASCVLAAWARGRPSSQRSLTGRVCEASWWPLYPWFSRWQLSCDEDGWGVRWKTVHHRLAIPGHLSLHHTSDYNMCLIAYKAIHDLAPTHRLREGLIQLEHKVFLVNSEISGMCLQIQIKGLPIVLCVLIHCYSASHASKHGIFYFLSLYILFMLLDCLDVIWKVCRYLYADVILYMVYGTPVVSCRTPCSVGVLTARWNIRVKVLLM